MAAAATATSALCEERDQRACGGGAGSGGVVLLRDGVVAEEHPATGRLRDNAGHAIRRLRGARRLLRHAPASWAQWGALHTKRVTSVGCVDAAACLGVEWAACVCGQVGAAFSMTPQLSNCWARRGEMESAANGTASR
eukprot:364789-Chlamydomonas_euryale.AAC.6